MTISNPILETLFTNFVELIKKNTGEHFQTFAGSKYLAKNENYKYKVYADAREKLGNKFWKSDDIGTGKIQKDVNLAIQARVYDNFQWFTNNLVDWRKKNDFSKRSVKRTLEATIFNFYKSKIKDNEAFEQFVNEGISYQFIAYLYFIKDKQNFLPISQERFDLIFELLGIPDFKTSGNCSWDNYSEFCGIIKQVRDFLKTKDKNSTLLDAHSFLWILGEQVKGPKHVLPQPVSPKEPPTQPVPIKEKVIEPEFSSATELTSMQWTEILQDMDITNDLDLSIFQVLYNFPDHRAHASQIASILGTTHPVLNAEIGRYAKRIAELYDIIFTARSVEQDKFWDLFFTGWDEGTKFVWQLRPELIDALSETGLEEEKYQYPEELPVDCADPLFEGMKRSIIVNSFERNYRARKLCVKHWKALCAVCGFDFEKIYGEMGKGFIHVHHTTPISQIGTAYQIDPIKDLIPVCPNCHAMLHRFEPTMTVGELRAKLQTLI